MPRSLPPSSPRVITPWSAQSFVRTIENQEENQDRASLEDRVSTIRTEADQLRNQLGEVRLHSMRVNKVRMEDRFGLEEEELALTAVGSRR